MSTFFTIAVIILVFLIIFQIAKASEYVAVLKGEEKSRKENNKVNGFFMIAFLIIGLIGVYWCNQLFFGKTLLSHEAASIQGEKVDSMMKLTLLITGIVFIFIRAVPISSSCSCFSISGTVIILARCCGIYRKYLRRFTINFQL